MIYFKMMENFKYHDEYILNNIIDSNINSIDNNLLY